MKKLLVTSLVVIFLVSCGSEEDNKRTANDNINNLRASEGSGSKKDKNKNVNGTSDGLSESEIAELLKSIKTGKFNDDSHTITGSHESNNAENVNGKGFDEVEKALNTQTKMMANTRELVSLIKFICEGSDSHHCEGFNRSPVKSQDNL